MDPAGFRADLVGHPEITIYSAPKAFEGHIGLIQTNAIQSWLALGPRVEVILLGRDAGVAEIADQLGIRHIPDIKTNKFGTPLLSSLMATAEANSAAPFLCMINADIILTSDFLSFLDKMKKLHPALFIGLRSDLDVTDVIDTSDDDWDRQLLDRVKQHGRFRGGGDDSFNGTDYYIYPKGLYPSVPPFAIGRFFWDSWLIADVYRRNKPVVNISADLLAVHQNHGYGHVRSGAVVDMYRYWLNDELKENHRLAGGFLDLMGPREAKYKVADGALVRIPGKSLWRARRYNLWYYYPIILRASLFRPRPLQRLWGYLFPFDSQQGRHHLSWKGPIRWAAYEIARPVWKLLPARVREAGHIAVEDPARFRQIVRSKLRRSFGLRRTSPPVIDMAPQAVATSPQQSLVADCDAAVYRWILNDNIREGEKTLASASLQGRISNSFGINYFNARKTWAAIDIDFKHAVIARSELGKLIRQCCHSARSFQSGFPRRRQFGIQPPPIQFPIVMSRVAGVSYDGNR